MASWLWAGLALVLVPILFYFLRHRRKQILPVASLIPWEEILGRYRNIWRRDWLELLLQVLVLGSLWLAWVAGVDLLESGEAVANQTNTERLILVDDSFSNSYQPQGQAALIDRVRRAYRLDEKGRAPKTRVFALSLFERDLWNAPPGLPRNWANGPNQIWGNFAWFSEQIRSGASGWSGEVHLVSRFCLPAIPETVARGEGPRWKFISTRASPAPNPNFYFREVRVYPDPLNRDRVLVRGRVGGAKPEGVEIWLKIGDENRGHWSFGDQKAGEPDDLEPDEFLIQAWDKRQNWPLRLTLTGDSLVYDNQYYLWWRESGQIRLWVPDTAWGEIWQKVFVPVYQENTRFQWSEYSTANPKVVLSQAKPKDVLLAPTSLTGNFNAADFPGRILYVYDGKMAANLPGSLKQTGWIPAAGQDFSRFLVTPWGELGFRSYLKPVATGDTGNAPRHWGNGEIAVAATDNGKAFLFTGKVDGSQTDTLLSPAFPFFWHSLVYELVGGGMGEDLRGDRAARENLGRVPAGPGLIKPEPGQDNQFKAFNPDARESACRLVPTNELQKILPGPLENLPEKHSSTTGWLPPGKWWFFLLAGLLFFLLRYRP